MVVKGEHLNFSDEECGDKEQPSTPSRSARKREAKEVEHLALALVELSAAEFNRLPTHTDVLAELTKARATKGHGARKRQLKFVAGMLRRDLEAAEQLRAFVAGEHQQQRDERRLNHQLERLRDQLCEPSTRQQALEQVAELFAAIDMLELRRLLDRYHGADDKKNYRQIFRCLRAGSEIAND
ncbi:MAG: hypothetical protein B6I36_01105 [Desulfobacteraceae bacterium 4572_35.1]|nr:MAG: hypothetical protein B6I36_01105 [Desulfobacteraceae bacterium 4572_35.1]